MKKVLIPILVILLIASFSLSAFAEESPVATAVNSVIAESDSGNGTVDKVINADGTITLTATPNADGTFDKWVIDGDYEIVEGSLTSLVIVIRPKSDVKAVALFKGATEAPTTAEGNKDDVAPKAGNNNVVYIGLAMLVAFAAVVAAKKKLIKD